MPKDTSKVFGGISIILIIVFTAFLIPGIILSLSDTQSKHITQQDNVKTSITTEFNSNLENYNLNTMNMTMVNSNNGNVYKIDNVSLGEQRNITVTGGYVNVTYENYVNDNYALISYEYPTYLNWPDGAQFIAENLALYLVSVILIFLVSIIIAAFYYGGKQ